VKAALVPAGLVDTCWDEVAPMLERATDRSGGRYSIEDVYNKIVNEIAHLWVALEGKEIVAAFVTEITAYGQKKMLTVQFAGGSKMIEWVGEIDSIFRRWALDNGCSGVELTGRKGWVKALEGLGWKPSFVVVEKSYE
jgi:hypothetical protein|tara:strand:+ start:201 stop:614 length:414 start_codon:yes stop_codon:yes gene_type:complete